MPKRDLILFCIMLIMIGVQPIFGSGAPETVLTALTPQNFTVVNNHNNWYSASGPTFSWNASPATYVYRDGFFNLTVHNLTLKYYCIYQFIDRTIVGPPLEASLPVYATSTTATIPIKVNGIQIEISSVYNDSASSSDIVSNSTGLGLTIHIDDAAPVISVSTSPNRNYSAAIT